MNKNSVAWNLRRCLLLPVFLYFAIYWTCYEILWWAMIMERSRWTKGASTPIGDGMEFLRDLAPGRWAKPKENSFRGKEA